MLKLGLYNFLTLLLINIMSCTSLSGQDFDRIVIFRYIGGGMDDCAEKIEVTQKQVRYFNCHLDSLKYSEIQNVNPSDFLKTSSEEYRQLGVFSINPSIANCVSTKYVYDLYLYHRNEREITRVFDFKDCSDAGKGINSLMQQIKRLFLNE